MSLRACTASDDTARDSRRERGAQTERPDHADAAGRCEPVAARIALLGTGAVGRAWLARVLEARAGSSAASISLVRIANSRGGRSADGGLQLPELQLDPAVCGRGEWRPDERGLQDISAPDACVAALGRHGTRIIVDATASDAIAGQHATWLAQGIHVVTACKLGQGTSLPRWHAIQRAQREAGTRYGDAATVGAGLPLLRTVRALRAGGDRLHALGAVLSGSLAWLFANFDGRQTFSSLLRQAQQRGYTEPDPRDDLSGADVARKLTILLRSAGVGQQANAIAIEPLSGAEGPHPSSSGGLDALDADMHRRILAAQNSGKQLRYVARFDTRGARVGLEALPPSDPLAPASGCDNRMALWTDRYRDSPLLIQGPGAGADVTAAALLDDVLQIIAAGHRAS